MQEWNRREIYEECVYKCSFHVLVLFFSDPCQELPRGFVQTKHEVRIDSLIASMMLTSSIKTKVLKDKMERENASTGPARALTAWQRRGMQCEAPPDLLFHVGDIFIPRYPVSCLLKYFTPLPKYSTEGTSSILCCSRSSVQIYPWVGESGYLMRYSTRERVVLPPIFQIPDTQQQTQSVGFEFIEV